MSKFVGPRDIFIFVCCQLWMVVRLITDAWNFVVLAFQGRLRRKYPNTVINSVVKVITYCVLLFTHIESIVVVYF